MIIKTLNEELVEIKKWMVILNEDNLIGVGHFPTETMDPDYRESYGESTEMNNLGLPDSEMSGYMDEAIKHLEDKWVIVSKEGKILGKYISREEALEKIKRK